MPVHKINIADIRKDYRLAALDDATAGNDPLAFFNTWFSDAQKAEISETNAMTLATADAAGKPHARIVLLKGIDDGGFTFYTNYNSAKGRQLQANPIAALVFFWKELERQVRVEGKIEKITASESDEYFNSRPEGSRLSAWTSPQSEVIKERDVLEEAYKKYSQQFRTNIPRPPYWGGYRLVPELIEFWQGRSNRLHDRIVFTFKNNIWKKERLAP